MEIYNNILNFNELSSTNTYAFELLRSKPVAEFTTIRAYNQTLGKGQRGNSWNSEIGKNLTFSILLYPTQILPANQFIISQCVSLGLQKIISNYCTNVYVKWPNDIYVNNKKIAGILIENILQGSKIKSCVVGIGFNVNQEIFDESIPNPTSLKKETGIEYDLDILLRQCIVTICELYNSISSQENQIQNSYLQVLYKKGEKSLFEDAHGEFYGIINSVDSNGKLIIEDELGKFRSFFFKEVFYK